MNYLIVGAKFRPPAKVLLDSLPMGTPLVARREPSNPHDPNAIMVLVLSRDLSAWTRVDTLEEALTGFGMTLDELLAAREWHLGYIPRDQAALIAPRLDGAGITQVAGGLTFNAQGLPAIALDGVLP